jgi:hypothetical protein
MPFDASSAARRCPEKHTGPGKALPPVLASGQTKKEKVPSTLIRRSPDASEVEGALFLGNKKAQTREKSSPGLTLQ